MSESVGEHSIKDAIDICESNIKRHSKMSAYVAVVGASLVMTILGFAGAYASLSGASQDSTRVEELQSIVSLEKQMKDRASRKESARNRLNEMNEILQKHLVNQPASSAHNDGSNEISASKWKRTKFDLETQVRLAETRLEELNQAVDDVSKSLAAARGEFRNYVAKPLITQEIMIGVVALVVLVIGVFSALYRFHLKEISRNEQLHTAFLRIGLAASNHDQEGFQSEVRVALTKDAFSAGADSLFGKKDKKIESPLPGHPTTDVATSLVNKLLDQVEVVMKPKSTT